MENSAQVQEEVKPAIVRYRKTTLRELGNRLPIFRLGRDKKPEKDNEFTFQEWDMETEEYLSGKAEKAKNVGSFVNELMCKMLDNFCGINFQSMKEEQRSLMLNQLDWPNMMYMYIYLRIEEMGPMIGINMKCPEERCGEHIDMKVDLNDLDVHVKEYDFEKNEPIHSRIAVYELLKPIILGEKKVITHFEFDVSKWDCMERLDRKEAGGSSAVLKKVMLRSSVVNFYVDGKKPESGFIDTNEVIKKMKKVDIEHCISLVMENNAGITPILLGECPHCKGKFFKSLDWTYATFFGSSSL